ncbi:HD domain-containing protein [Candidatus Soleaferrea massiliensis]|uniref:HD domain-containing protein n=1 Tax=Candidatus Soleaferrea massiliensis TaxID=1470354 RepID=UPI00058E780D|nr:HD domain-containing protein [Candidatus Soleaferrea massiliensis]
MSHVTFKQVQNHAEIKTYIQKADEALEKQGYTEHSFAHVTKVAETAKDLLIRLGYSEREAELAQIAGFLHDIGNVINRVDHAQSSAVMAFRILDRMKMPPDEVATVIAAIGNHDEETAFAVSPIAAALILADKSDVRRTRVRNRDFATFDIHDRVNYAVEDSRLILDADTRSITLDLKIDTKICSVVDYFEIFLNRMLLCRRAADFLECQFRLNVNGTALL